MPFLLRLTLLVLLSAVAAFSGLLITVSGQMNQERDRVIEKQLFPNEPVEITEVKTKKGLRKTGEKFKDADDWFKGLTIKIKNSSDKPVNYVNVLVTFTRPQAQKEGGQIPFGEPLIYGISPADSKNSSSSTTAPSIPPGGSIELSLPEKYFDEYKALLKKLDFPDAIKRIELSLQEIGFEDGLLWSAGEFWRRDSHDPNKWLRQPQASGNGSPDFFLSTAGKRNHFRGFAQKVSWVASQPDEAPPECRQTGPELAIECAEGSECVVRERMAHLESSTTTLPQRINQRCRKNDGSFCEPVSQREVVVAAACPTPTPTPSWTAAASAT